MRRTSLEPEYFESMFRETSDPWNLETSAYERDKYLQSIRALGRRVYDRAFEVGCAKGVFTQMLVSHCRSLLSIDVSETALKAARQRNVAARQVAFDVMRFPGIAPSGTFDLVVLSEVAYYWDDADIARAADWVAAHLVPGGDVLLVHWTGETDYPQSGDDAVLKMQSALGDAVAVMASTRTDDYRLDLWRKL
ncbi:type 12 methyltransferase [Novosphingobium sp. Rr 2-17]|uniref:SAM-dependent methyltransferase n=1 Tax=Novosphingobium sp. Rr 2-17 TaxID=555793 RepID=UPI0002699504|nr:SAM-dependent methyltransferase [Novosphingobium sp. Rr 2-17]EIZ79857.1 type 12 methyltransferase [Novosphingobium sp. Rr 2-17]